APIGDRDTIKALALLRLYTSNDLDAPCVKSCGLEGWQERIEAVRAGMRKDCDLINQMGVIRDHMIHIRPNNPEAAALTEFVMKEYSESMKRARDVNLSVLLEKYRQGLC